MTGRETRFVEKEWKEKKKSKLLTKEKKPTPNLRASLKKKKNSLSLCLHTARALLLPRARALFLRLQ